MRWTASKLSRFCAHHHLLSDLNPRPTRDAAAKKGTAFHESLSAWHEMGLIPYAGSDEVQAWLQTMVDHGWEWPDGCELEVAWGLDTWGKFCAVDEPRPHEYRSIAGDDLLTAGRADAAWVSDGATLVVVDFKTGRFHPAHPSQNLQVNAAGIALAQRWKADFYVPCIYLARDGIWQTGDAVETNGPQWSAMLDEIKQAAALDDRPHPGPHCSDCWERKNCEAV